MRTLSPPRALSLILFAAALLVGCAQRPSVVVAVPNVPLEAATLRVRVSAAAMAAVETPEFDVRTQAAAANKPFSYRFGLHPPIGLTGTVSVGVGAYDAQGCLLSGGANDVTLDLMQTDSDIQVLLDPTPMENPPSCHTAMPALQAVIQPDSAQGTLVLTGFGFDPQAQVTIDNQPVAQVLLAHFDRMVVTPATLASPSGAKQVTVTVRNPDGSQDSKQLVVRSVIFSDPSPLTYTLPSGYAPYSVRIGDVNKDGKPDVVVGGLADTSAGFIYVYLNSGDGHLADPVIYKQRGPVETLELADMDGDGALDIVFTTIVPDNLIAVLHNPGNGQFSMTSYSSYACNGLPNVMAITDFDGDGRLDVFVTITYMGFAGALDLLLQQPDHSLQLLPGPFLPTFNNKPVLLDYISAADVDGDGTQDFVITFSAGSPNGGVMQLSGYLRPYYNTSAGLLQGADYPLGGATAVSALGDLDGDGKLDAAASGPLVSATMNGSNVSVYLNDGMQGFKTPGTRVPSGQRPFTVSLADLNHDKQLDIAVTDSQDTGQSSFTLLLNQGKGVFPPMNAPSYATGYGQTVMVSGDLNVDGRADLVTASFGSPTANQPPQVIVYLNITP